MIPEDPTEESFKASVLTGLRRQYAIRMHCRAAHFRRLPGTNKRIYMPPTLVVPRKYGYSKAKG